MMDFNMTKDAMKLALEALEYIDLCDNDRDFLHPHECFQLDEVITAIKQALAAPVQEPVAWRWLNKETGKVGAYFEDPANFFDLEKQSNYEWTPLYTTPPNVATPLAAQRQWQGLTDEEKQEWIDAMPYTIEPRHCMILVNVMEAKLKEKNCD
jgi:hypothetical protein